MQDRESLGARLKSELLNLALFTLRCVIFAGILGLGLAFSVKSVLKSIDTRATVQNLQRELRDEKTRIRLTGLTSNPQVHYRVAQIEEEKGNLRGAILEMELGLGLLELHNSDRAVRERYARRLEELKRKLPPPDSKGKK